MPYRVESKDVSARPAAVVKFTASVPEMGERMGAAFGEVMQYVTQSGAQSPGQRLLTASSWAVSASTFGPGSSSPLRSRATAA